jgi:two-component system chemotaxis response regulator CheB
LICKRINKKEEGFEGILKNIQLPDLIQMCCLSSINMAIRVTKDSQQGTIYIQHGSITHAECRNIVGENAFYEILAWESGGFETMKIDAAPETTIEKNWQYLLMEAVRLIDEGAIKNRMSADAAEEIQPFQETDRLRVLIVDDSAVMRRILENILTDDEEISVVGTARNGEEALLKIDELKPDLITMDVNMPVMDGNTALKHIMIKSPCPVVIISSMGDSAQRNILEFLRLGAVDFICKPVKNEDMSRQKQQILEKIRLAANARIHHFKRVRAPKAVVKETTETGVEAPCKRLVVISSGIGGYAEIIRLIPLLPADLKACLLVLQTMPREFVTPLSDYLNKVSRTSVLPLQSDSPLLCNRCYLGTHDYSLVLNSGQGGYSILLEDPSSKIESRISSHDSFLHSIADVFSENAFVVLFSGAEVGNMDGLESIRENNGLVIVQQLESCIVPFPLEKAMKARLVDCQASENEIVEQILRDIR